MVKRFYRELKRPDTCCAEPIWQVSRINWLFGSPSEPNTENDRFTRLPKFTQSVVIRECVRVSFIVTYTSSEQAMQAVTYQ